MIAICWHFAYGIWLFAAKWGITPEKPRGAASAGFASRWESCSPAWEWPASGPLSALGMPMPPIPNPSRLCA